MKKLFSSLIVCLTIHSAQAQTPITGGNDSTLFKKMGELEKQLRFLKYLSFSGYVQAQFQVADSSGIKSFSGGDFATNTDKRFTVRRGRLRVIYDNNKTKFDLQIQAGERPTNGFPVQVMNIYGKFTEQKFKAFSLTAGIFNKPFGYEIAYSSRDRITPERGRMSQLLFTVERDCGAMLTFKSPVQKWKFMTIQAGFFNGTGPNASDFDKKKDFIGQVILQKSFLNDAVQLSGGFSHYNGGIRIANKSVYSRIYNQGDSLKTYHEDSSSANVNCFAKKIYYGADLQFSVKTKLGITSIKGEYIFGQQPGSAVSTAMATTEITTPIFIRNFNGAYFYLSQKLGKTNHTLSFKYDFYDPNTDVKGNEIGQPGSGLSAADIRYNTLGLGYIYDWDNVRFMLWADLVKNETSVNLANFSKDVKDNVLTVRIQYKF